MVVHDVNVDVNVDFNISKTINTISYMLHSILKNITISGYIKDI